MAALLQEIRYNAAATASVGSTVGVLIIPSGLHENRTINLHALGIGKVTVRCRTPCITHNDNNDDDYADGNNNIVVKLCYLSMQPSSTTMMIGETLI